MAAPLIGPTFAAELAAAGVALDGLSWDCVTGVVLASDGPDHLAAAQAVLARQDPTRAAPAYLTGGDIIDGMSPAQASAAGVDVRDLVRIQAAPTAVEVKSKIARVEKALKLTAGTLAAQASPTGGL